MPPAASGFPRTLLLGSRVKVGSSVKGEEERLELGDRIRRLKRNLETAAETVDAQHSGLERMWS